MKVPKYILKCANCGHWIIFDDKNHEIKHYEPSSGGAGNGVDTNGCCQCECVSAELPFDSVEEAKNYLMARRRGRIISFMVLEESILLGTKAQTIRKPRKRPFKVDEKVQVWWKQRSQIGHKLFDAVITSIEDVYIETITKEQAVADGFNDVRECKKWFKKTHGDRWDEVFKLIKFKPFEDTTQKRLCEFLLKNKINKEVIK
jgi:uncharacterized protein YqfB (UPF0267 family)